MADLASARREAERAMARWDSLPVTHRYDYEAAEVIRALRSLLAASPEPATATETRAERMAHVIRETQREEMAEHLTDLATVYGPANTEPATALPDEVREAAERHIHAKDAAASCLCVGRGECPHEMSERETEAALRAALGGAR